MSQQTPVTPPRADDALVESLRLTGFTEQSVRLAETTWWSDVTGAEPQQRMSMPGQGTFQDVGSFGEQALVLSVQAGRIDWFLTPPAVAGVQAGIRSAGVFPAAFSAFLEPMLRWFRVSPPLIRLAFGAVVLVPVESKENGYRRLSEFLPTVRIDPTGSEDFLYQINRPRNSRELQGLRLNRLSKWSVALFQGFQIGIPTGLPQPVVSRLGERAFACRVELDISTAADHSGILPPQSLGEILRTLVNLGSEIVLRGDVE
jgi:hypothetical protein